VIFKNQEQLDEVCAEWQKTLRLQDWKVKVNIRRQNEMSINNVAGEVDWTLTLKQANINILDKVDYPPDLMTPQDQEQVLVHELLHLHFAPFDDFDRDSKEYVLMEQAIDLIACGLVDAKRR
jgi:hypothetical protein